MNRFADSHKLNRLRVPRFADPFFANRVLGHRKFEAIHTNCTNIVNLRGGKCPHQFQKKDWEFSGTMEKQIFCHPILVPLIPTFSFQGVLWQCWAKQEGVAHAHVAISLLHFHDCWMIHIRVFDIAWLGMKLAPPSSAIRNIVKDGRLQIPNTRKGFVCLGWSPRVFLANYGVFGTAPLVPRNLAILFLKTFLGTIREPAS